MISNDLDVTVSLAIGIPQFKGHRPLAIWKTMSGEFASLTSEYCDLVLNATWHRKGTTLFASSLER